MIPTRTLVLPDEEAPTSVDAKTERFRRVRRDRSGRRSWLGLALVAGAAVCSVALSAVSVIETRRAVTELREALDLPGVARAGLTPIAGPSSPREHQSARGVHPESAGALAMELSFLERRASELVAARDYGSALPLYRELSRRSPDSPVFRDFSVVLQHKLGCRRATVGEPGTCR